MDFTCHGIPTYDATKDPYCPIAHTQKFKRQRLKRLRQEHFAISKLTKSNLQIACHPNRRRLEPLPRTPRRIDANGSGRNIQESGNINKLPITLVTKSGGITWCSGTIAKNNATLPSADVEGSARSGPNPIDAWMPAKSLCPEQELEALKSIILREGYLKRLETTVNDWLSSGGEVPDDVGGLLDLIRMATVEVVEALVKWRLSTGGSAPFLWNGINYLLKIPSDLDTLDLLSSLGRWVGFSLERNPFVLALPLDFQRAKASVDAPRVGNKRADSNHPEHNEMQIAPITVQKKDGVRYRPYRTPVVNDPSLIAERDKARNSEAFPIQVSPGRDRMLSASSTQRCTGKRMTKPIISESDQERIRQAERVLLQEEESHGRYTRNQSGRLVPEQLAKDELFNQQLGLDKKRDLTEPALADAFTAPHAEFSGVGRVKTSEAKQVEVAKLRLEYHGKSDMKTLEEKFLFQKTPPYSPRMFDPDSSGASRAARRGELGLGRQTSATTAGRKRAPTKRSRGAALDSEVIRLQREATRLSHEIEDLCSDNAADIGEAETLETTADRLDAEEQARKSRNKATQDDIQRSQRGTEARQEARDRALRLRDNCARREIQIRELEVVRDTRLREAKERAREHFELKRSERVVDDRRRALELERERRMLGENAVHPDDEAAARTLEDKSMSAIQRIARGKVTRLYTAKLRQTFARAGVVITAAVRGHFARRRARRYRLVKYGATCIQRHARSSFARVVVATMKHDKLKNEAAVRVEALFHGMRARRRVKRRRQLRLAAAKAADAVSVRSLCPEDLYELANAIHHAQIDYRAAYPSAAVLGLMRIVVLILSDESNDAVVGEARFQDECSNDARHFREVVTDYNAFGVRQSLAVERIDMTWNEAMKLLRRAHRLLRRLRALAAGPASTPPRLLSLPRIALELYDAYAHDPTMTVEAMRRIPKGSRACVQFLTFLAALQRVYKVQADFFEDLGGDEMTPNWLIRKRVAAKRRRALSVNAVLHKHAANYAEAACAKRRSAGKQFPTEAACFEHERAQAYSANDALAAHDAAEGTQTARLVVQIQEELTRRKHSVDVAARRVAAADHDLAEASRLSRYENSHTALQRLPALRNAAAEARVGLREARARLATSKRDNAVAEKRQANVIIELPPEVRYRAIAAGEARAAAWIAMESRQSWIRNRGGERHVRRLAACEPRPVDGLRGNSLSSLTRREYTELCELDVQVDETRERTRLASEALACVTEELESEICKAEEDERVKYARPAATLEPTDEERAEDAREDEYCAVEEAALLRQFVPAVFLPALSRELRAIAKASAENAVACVLSRSKIKPIFAELKDDDSSVLIQDSDFEKPPDRPRPVLVLISRDVARAAKDRIVEELEHELPGLFVRTIATDAPLGIDTSVFQAPLSINKSIIAEVDAGLSAESRLGFLDALSLTKASLIPTPQIVLVIGDARNRRGPVPPNLPGHYGVSGSDLCIMKDSILKQQYQEASENLALLTQRRSLDALAGWSQLEYPPSKGHALVLEATILMLQRNTRLKCPEETISAVAWIAARRLLAHPLELVGRLREVDPSRLPTATIILMRSYCEAVNWPKIDGLQADTVSLGCLVRWISAVVAAGEYLSAHGGAAPTISRRMPDDLFSRVVIVSDGRDAFDEESEATPRGWRAAFVQIAETVLEDCRGHRCAARLTTASAPAINGFATPKDTVYNVSVYQDCGRIFFIAYNPTTSISLFTSIHERDVNPLLAPNSIEHAAHSAKKPPDTLVEMYARLVALLVIDQSVPVPSRVSPCRTSVASPDATIHVGQLSSTPNKSPRLVCRRRLHRLLRQTRRISGYLTTLTAYEEARGELRIHAYVTDHAASLERRIDVHILKRLYLHADVTLGERTALESSDAARMLSFIVDRVEIVPGRAQAQDMDGLCSVRDLLSYERRWIDRTSGLCLRIRSVQGPGRRVHRAPVRVSGELMIMTLYEAAIGSNDYLLRLLLYDPTSAATQEFRLSKTHCALLLEGPVTGNWRSWHDSLTKRISVRRCTALPDSIGRTRLCRGRISIDATIYRNVFIIGGCRTRISVELTADEGLILRTLDTGLNTRAQSEQKRALSTGVSSQVAKKKRTLSPKKKLREYILCRQDRDSKSNIVQQAMYLKSSELATVWKLQPGTRTPVFDKLGSASDADRKRYIEEILGELTRDSDTGAIMLGNTLSTTYPSRPLLGPRLIDVSHQATSIEHDGSAESVLRMRRQAKVKKHTLEPPGPDEVYRVDWMAKPVYHGSLPLEEESVPERGASSIENRDERTSEAPTEHFQAVSISRNNSDVVEERLVYQQGVKARVKPLDVNTYEELYGRNVREDGFAVEVVFVKVFETFSAGAATWELRFEIYRATTSAIQSTVISGQRGLREALGTNGQHLCDPEKRETMLRFLVAERLVLHEGVWDPATDQFVREDNVFSASFKTNRIYEAESKVTPLGAGGSADTKANANVLFSESDGVLARGCKVLRQAQEICGVLMHVTAFEMPMSQHDVHTGIPRFRFVVYNPHAQHTSKLFVPSDSVAEVLNALDREHPGFLKKPSTRLRDPANRFDLARAVAKHLRLHSSHRAPPEVYFPWPRTQVQPPVLFGADPEPDTLLDEQNTGLLMGADERYRQRRLSVLNRFTRQTEETARKRADLVLRRMTRISNHDVIVSIFAPPLPRHLLQVHVFLPHIAGSVELRIDAEEQRQSLGRAILEHADGEPRDAAFDLLLRNLHLHGVPRKKESDVENEELCDDKLDVVTDSGKRHGISLTLEANPNRPWLTAYKSLDTSIPVQDNRPRGYPVRFVPSNTKGDLLLRKGMTIPNGGEVVVTVSSRAKGEPASHGLVIEVYEPITSYTTTLHIVEKELRKLTGFDVSHFNQDRLLTTINSILSRLYILSSYDGQIQLALAQNNALSTINVD